MTSKLAIWRKGPVGGGGLFYIFLIIPLIVADGNFASAAWPGEQGVPGVLGTLLGAGQRQHQLNLVKQGQTKPYLFFKKF